MGLLGSSGGAREPERIAEELGEALRSNGGFWLRKRSVDVAWGYTIVRADVWPANQYGWCRVRLRAPFLLPCGPRLRLLTQGTVRMWLRGFGYQDIDIGHSRFDLDVTVKGEPAEQVIATLLPVADQIVRLGMLPSLRTTAREARASFLVGVDDLSAVLAHIDIIGAIANTDFYGLDVLSSLPGVETVVPNEPGPPRFRLRLPSPIELAVELGGATSETPTTVARAEVGRIEDLGSLDLYDTSTSPFAPLAQLRRRAAGGRLVKENETLALYWDRICRDVDELVEVATLLARASRAVSTGAYR